MYEIIRAYPSNRDTPRNLKYVRLAQSSYVTRSSHTQRRTRTRKTTMQEHNMIKKNIACAYIIARAPHNNDFLLLACLALTAFCSSVVGATTDPKRTPQQDQIFLRR